MILSKANNCSDCSLKCDIYLTAKEMNIENELNAVTITYKKYENICKQNTIATKSIILVDGNAKMYIDGINNKNIILNILLPSNYIGLLSIFGAPNFQYNVAALTKCITCQIDIDFIKLLYYNNHNFLTRINIAFVKSVSSIMNKLISVNQKQIRGKVAESLLYLSQLYESSKFELTITRKELAELSAISEENAVRVLTEFKNEKIIDIIGKTIELVDIEMLKKLNIIG